MSPRRTFSLALLEYLCEKVLTLFEKYYDYLLHGKINVFERNIEL